MQPELIPASLKLGLILSEILDGSYLIGKDACTQRGKGMRACGIKQN